MKSSKLDNKKDFYDSYHKKNDMFFAVIKDRDFTYFYILTELQKILKTQNVRKALDIGCGVGTLAFYVNSKGVIVDGYDVSKRAISIAKKFKSFANIREVNFFNADVQVENYRNVYDLVICTEVIEHLENDKKMVNVIHESLHKNGYLLLSTPSKNAPLFKLGLLKSFDREVGHLRRYSILELESLIEECGFKIIKSKKVEGILRNSLFTFPLLGYFIKLIKGPLIPIFHIFDKLSVILFGESDLIVIAQKL